MGRDGFIYEYDWDVGCYLMSPEFSFFNFFLFDDGGIEQLKVLGFIKDISGCKVWAIII